MSRACAWPRLGALTCVMLGLVGCETVGNAFNGTHPDGNEPPLARALDRQIDELDRLGSAPVDERITLYQQIELDYVENPSDANQLRLALAKSVPGHPATDQRAAVDDISILLGRANTLSPTQVHLAKMTARQLDTRIALSSELQQLRARVTELEKSTTAQSTRDDRRLRAARARIEQLEALNTTLTDELAQAQQQLDAIMSIETSSDPGN